MTGLVAQILRAEHGSDDGDHGADPPVGARLRVLEIELNADGRADTVIVDWMNLRWPMLVEDVELRPGLEGYK